MSDNLPMESITKEKVIHYLEAFGLANQLTKQEIGQFCEIAQAFNLNPFKREVYCLPYGQGDKRKLSIITGYEVYLKRAERIGALDGWSARIEEKGGSFTAIVEIYRKDWSKPFVHEVYYEEVVQTKYDGTPTATWAKMPRFMTKKVAIAQAFRMAFPDEMGGMPYTSEEVPEEMSTMKMAEPEYIPPQQAPQSQATATPKSTKQQSDPNHHMLAIGEVVPNWFWSLKKEDRRQYIPDGGALGKVAGKWQVVAEEVA
jgi:phage recombination protein Bet